MGGVTGGLGHRWTWVESRVRWVIGGFGWSDRWVGSWVVLGGVTGGLGHRWIWVESQVGWVLGGFGWNHWWVGS